MTPKNLLRALVAVTALPLAVVAPSAGTYVYAQTANAETTPTVAPVRDPVAAEVLFLEGRRLLKMGELGAACSKLEESHRLDPATGTLANLADCEERLGKSASAWEHWRRVGEQLRVGDPRRATALGRSAELEKNLARLTVQIDESAGPAPVGLVVKRDAVILGPASLGLALPLDPGPHTVVVSAADRLPRSYDVTLAPGQQLKLAVQPGPLRPPQALLVTPKATPGPPIEATTKGGRRWAGYLVLGAGVAAAGTGAFFGTRALSARQDAKKGCARATGSTPPVCAAGARDALARDTRYSRFADIGFAAGAVAASAGLYLILSAGGKAAEGKTVARVGASPLLDGAEVQIAGHF